MLLFLAVFGLFNGGGLMSLVVLGGAACWIGSRGNARPVSPPPAQPAVGRPVHRVPRQQPDPWPVWPAAAGVAAGYYLGRDEKPATDSAAADLELQVGDECCDDASGDAEAGDGWFAEPHVDPLDSSWGTTGGGGA